MCRHCATLATYHGLPHVLNSILITTSKHALEFMQDVVALPTAATAHVTLHLTDLSSSANSRSRSSAATGSVVQAAASSPMKGSRSANHRHEDPDASFRATPAASAVTAELTDGTDDNETNVHRNGASSAAAFAITRSLATLRAVLTLAAAYSSGLHESWRNIVDIILYLRSLGALPTWLDELDDFRGPGGHHLPSLRALAHGETRGRGDSAGSASSLAASNSGGGGLWGVFSGMLWSDEPEVEENAMVVDCIRREVAAAPVQALLGQMASIKHDSLQDFCKALVLARDPKVKLQAKDCTWG